MSDGARTSGSSLAALDLVSADLLVQVGSLDAQKDRGARDVPPGELQRVDDVLALGPFPKLTQCQMLGSGGGRRKTARRLDHGSVVDRIGHVCRLGGSPFVLFLERARMRILGQIGNRDAIATQDGGALDRI